MAREAGQIVQEELDAQQEARRRTALAQIRQFGDPILRMEAREVEEFDDDLRRLVTRMKRLMEEARGIGLAGTQVGVLSRLAVVHLDEDEEPVVLVNPRIVERSAETEIDDEGCLSLQGVLVPVERAVSVVVEARDEHGGELRLDVADLAARVVQHELDHLDGVLILDRTTDAARREAMRTLRPRTILA